MNISLHKRFKKHYKLRIASNTSLKKRFEERYNLFISNPNDPILKDHALAGEKIGMRSFWITGDIRVTYMVKENEIRFYDIGSHNQVY